MLLIFIIILASAGLLWGIKIFTAKPDVMSAEIFQDGKLLRRVFLRKGDQTRDFIIEYRGGYNKIRTEDGMIAVIEADCPDKDCVKKGWLKRPGDSAVCLPHRLVIRIAGEPEVEGVTY
ncbi:MAG: NusG domain II-containing protein [Synergistaceae bacterium]|nr:NusG domain II-containing protein [Synergistaceae bacterium]